jgi:hypothetical protein
MTPARSIVSRGARASAARLVAAAAIAATAVSGCGSSTTHTVTVHHTTTAAATATASPGITSGGFTAKPFASGIAITINTPAGKVSINQPDDITKLGGNIFVGFQNNVGPQGEPTPKGSAGTGNLDSTIVEFSSSGSPVAHWNIKGHVDGVTADLATSQVVVTTNEDAHARLFTISPSSSQATEYKVPSPLPHNGGLDAISFWHGMLLISASAPGTTGKAPPQASYPALYDVTLDSSNHTASVRGLFSDEATAKHANAGKSGTMKLALVDPDSNFVVPSYAARFGGQLMLTSQGDYLNIFVADTGFKQLSALKLSQSIDDSQWASGPSGTLYVTDGSSDLIWKITGPFTKGMQIVGVTPCDAGNAPASCPAPPKFPGNYLGVVDMSTGHVSKFALTTPPISPAGLLFVP